MTSSRSEASLRSFFQISIEKSVAALLNIDVRELIRADIMTAIIKPFKPVIQTNEAKHEVVMDLS